MKIRIFIFTLLFAIGQNAFSQDSEWVDFEVIDFPGMDKVSLDNQGFIFLTDLEGNLYQFNKSGKVINNFSPHRQGRISQLEAGWTINIFTFSIDLQEYRILDRFMNPVSDNRIPLNLITLAKAATLGNNNIIWVFDEADLSLKQFNYMRNEVIQHQPLNLVLDRSSLDIIGMREYQNLLFINIKEEGIFILDNQGNLIKKTGAYPTQNFGFWKNRLIFIEDEKVVSMDFQSEKRDSFPLPEDFNAFGILVNQQIVLLYNTAQIRIYQKNKTPLKGQ